MNFIEEARGWRVEITLAVAFLVVNLLKWDNLGLMQVKYFFPYFAAGFLAAKYRGWIAGLGRERTDRVLLACSILFLALYAALLYAGRLNPYRFPMTISNLLTTPVEYLTRYLMAALGIAFSIGVIRALKSGRAREVLAWFGLVTMEIYLAHGITIRLTFGGGWTALLLSFFNGVVLSLALSFLVLRQTWPTAAVFLGIRPERRKRKAVAGAAA